MRFRIWKPKKEDVYPLMFLAAGTVSVIYVTVKIIRHFKG